MKEPKNLQRLQTSVMHWQLETFWKGHVQRLPINGWLNPFPTLSHLIDPQKGEIAELKAALYAFDTQAAAEELADCFILLLGIASLVGVDLYQAVDAKMAKNRARQWGDPDEQGIINHVEAHS